MKYLDHAWTKNKFSRAPLIDCLNIQAQFLQAPLHFMPLVLFKHLGYAKKWLNSPRACFHVDFQSHIIDSLIIRWC